MHGYISKRTLKVSTLQASVSYPTQGARWGAFMSYDHISSSVL